MKRAVWHNTPTVVAIAAVPAFGAVGCVSASEGGWGGFSWDGRPGVARERGGGGEGGRGSTYR